MTTGTLAPMLGRQKSGSVVCRSCGRLVGVGDSKCLNCGAANPALWGFAPVLRKLGDEAAVVQLIVAVCVVLYFLTLVVDLGGIRNSGLLGLLGPSAVSLLHFGASGRVPVLTLGRWWTVLSAGWLHGGLLHIGFNMFWLMQVGPLVGRFYGAGRMLIIYTAGSVAGFLLSTLAVFLPRLVTGLLGGVGGFTVGASAGFFGLLASLIWYGRRSGSGELSRRIWTYVIIFALFGLMVRTTDNWAHLGGFLGGWLASRALDPLQPERGTHLLGGLICLVLSVTAVVVSLLVPLQF